MKKVGIVTLNANTNFGNRLQNYALQYVLENLGYQASTIWFCNIKTFIKEKIKKYIFYFTNKRKYLFLNFSNKYIKTKYHFNNHIAKKYSYFIAGSDQIWNYNFPDFGDDMFLLFSPKEKNISYAASFGIDNIECQKQEIFYMGLSNFKNISVREDKGKSIINNILPNEHVEVLIDPTMLLSYEDWDKLITPIDIIDSKFILCYFLGEFSEERKVEISRVAIENNCIIINILDQSSKFYNCGPSEFLYLEKNAFLICTDSFHSSVFAMIFNRPFIVYDRNDKEKNMSSRIDTLLNKFQLKNRKYNNTNITKENLEHDYSKAYEILEKEREKSIKFLSDALNRS